MVTAYRIRLPVCGCTTAIGGFTSPKRVAVARSPIEDVRYVAMACRTVGKSGCGMSDADPLAGDVPAQQPHHLRVRLDPHHPELAEPGDAKNGILNPEQLR